MKPNSRLALALHTLGHMASEPERVRTSAQIAQHSGTNPVVVRRVLGRLKQAGLLLSEKGHAGGWWLAKSPQDITLADVYLALDEQMIAQEYSGQALSCSVEQALHDKVTVVLEEIERSLVQRLASTSISDISAT
ncbi:MAG: Rrf2 family transcriptional regulator [Ruegeria sp.]